MKNPFSKKREEKIAAQAAEHRAPVAEQVVLKLNEQLTARLEKEHERGLVAGYKEAQQDGDEFFTEFVAEVVKELNDIGNNKALVVERNAYQQAARHLLRKAERRGFSFD